MAIAAKMQRDIDRLNIDSFNAAGRLWGIGDFYLLLLFSLQPQCNETPAAEPIAATLSIWVQLEPPSQMESSAVL